MMTCSYYRHRSSRTLFAFRLVNGITVTAAAGPLSDLAEYQPAPSHKPNPELNVAGLNLAEFEQIGTIWNLSKKNRIAPGQTQPSGEVVMHEDDNSLSIGLSNV